MLHPRSLPLSKGKTNIYYKCSNLIQQTFFRNLQRARHRAESPSLVDFYSEKGKNIQNNQNSGSEQGHSYCRQEKSQPDSAFCSNPENSIGPIKHCFLKGK